jgi:hypothetical protein
VRQIRHHVGTAYATARHYAQRLDQGVNLASRVFAAARPILKYIAPVYEQKAAKGAAQAKESYDQMRGDVVDLHSRGQAHAEKLGDISSMLGL